METFWFIALAGMLATYVVLDGFDIGAGILSLFVARNDAERRQVISSVGPVWDGNEVWLVAAGGTLFFAFPKLFALAFSGFYLPLIMVLWFLIFRGLGIEMRHYFNDPLWNQFWDVAFFVSSLLLVIFFGAALGNVVRGVPIDEAGIFFEPLWTNFLVGENTGILDWYTVLVGVAALVSLTHHGALWLADRTEGPVAIRSTKWAKGLGPLVLVLALLITIPTFLIQPILKNNLAARPWGLVFPFLAFLGWLVSVIAIRKGATRKAFLGSAFYLYGMLATAAVGLYPYVLPARIPERGLTIDTASAGAYGLKLGLYWWIPGICIAIGYFVYMYSKLPRKFPLPKN